MPSTDTIVALATPPGRSGIGVIRLSGHQSLALVRRLLGDHAFHPESHRVYLKPLRDTRDQLLDQALVTWFRGPHSYTGEDVVELSCHGSPALLLEVLDQLLGLGARAADPGEFTLRALGHGRLNLTQAEAIRDLIDARTSVAVKQAARQLGGELSSRLGPVKQEILEIIVPLESSLEFVEDDLPRVAVERISQGLRAIISNLAGLAATFASGRLLREGLRVALVGRPNTGKSSLFNRLLSAERALVTAVPGTTRDSLNEPVNIEGTPVVLTDTAGVRESPDEVERLGIERTRRAIADADLALFVMDGSLPQGTEDEAVLTELGESAYVLVLNKCDLPGFSAANAPASAKGEPVAVSAKTGEGLEQLKRAILEPFATGGEQDGSFLITNARHHDLLERASEALGSSADLLDRRASEEIILVGLYQALEFLGEITGETTSEDVLTQIFATFCIGK